MKKINSIINEMVKIFKKNMVLDSVMFRYNGEMIQYGEYDICYDTMEFSIKDPEIIKYNVKDFEYPENLVVIYDGGNLYEAINGNYGWETWNVVEQELRDLLNKYKMTYERLNSTSMVLINE